MEVLGHKVVNLTLAVPVIVVGLIIIVFIPRGVIEIRSDQVGILIRKFSGQKMPQGQIIARHGQIGIQAHTLMPGLYFRNPIVWSVKKPPSPRFPRTMWAR